MTQSEQPAPSGYSLATLRVAIDTHDEAILTALTARQRLVDRIRDVKNREGQLVYRPAREAQILRRLLGAADSSLDKTLVHQLWREIFSSAVARQHPLTIAAVQSENVSMAEITRQNFGHAALVQTCTLHDALQKLLHSAVTLAVVPAAAVSDILATIHADKQIQINGILPFLSNGAGPEAYVLGRLLSEETGDDITLLNVNGNIEWLDGYHHNHPLCIGIAPRPFIQIASANV
jgi:chorismate mutase